MAASPELNAFFAAYGPAAAEMAETLEDAAKEAERLIKKHRSKGTKKGRLLAAEYAVIFKELRSQQAAMWKELTPELRGGMERSAMAAATAERAFDVYLRDADIDLPQLKASFRTQAQRGVELAMARGTAGGYPLSKQVYRTRAWSNRQLERTIRRGLVLGLDEDALAASVRNLIDPDVRGGVSYAAMRLARTEMNNAYHASAVARFDEPWALGVRWHLSSTHSASHKVPPEACEALALANNGLGVGVWPTGGVPRKPHPLCLCYITQVTIPEDEFLSRFLSGEFDEFMAEQVRKYPPKNDPVTQWLAAQPKGASKQTLINGAVKKFGISNREAALAVQAERSTAPAVPKKRAPKKTKLETPPEIPDAVADAPPPAPSQAGDVVAEHIHRIVEFGSVHRTRVERALTRQAGFTPRTMMTLNGVRELDRRAPSYGQPGVIGEYDERTQVLYLDASAFQAQAQETYTRERERGYVSRCGERFSSLDALIAHEYGHHAHDRWLLDAPNRGATWKAIAAALGVPPPSRYDERSLDNWAKRHKQLVENLVSKYATHTVLEMLAETWAEYTLGDPPRPHIQAIGEILQKAAEEAA